MIHPIYMWFICVLYTWHFVCKNCESMKNKFHMIFIITLLDWKIYDDYPLYEYYHYYYLKFLFQFVTYLAFSLYD